MTIYHLSKRFAFEAAHVLPRHDGKCARLHGHSWRGELWVRGDALQALGAQSGMLIDYSQLSAFLDPLVAQYLDHYYLNESIPDPAVAAAPTSELLAWWILREARAYFAGLVPRVEVLKVVIEETCTSRCEAM